MSYYNVASTCKQHVTPSFTAASYFINWQHVSSVESVNAVKEKCSIFLF